MRGRSVLLLLDKTVYLDWEGYCMYMESKAYHIGYPGKDGIKLPWSGWEHFPSTDAVYGNWDSVG